MSFGSSERIPNDWMMIADDLESNATTHNALSHSFATLWLFVYRQTHLSSIATTALPVCLCMRTIWRMNICIWEIFFDEMWKAYDKFSLYTIWFIRCVRRWKQWRTVRMPYIFIVFAFSHFPSKCTTLCASVCVIHYVRKQ